MIGIGNELSIRWVILQMLIGWRCLGANDARYGIEHERLDLEMEIRDVKTTRREDSLTEPQ